MISCSLRPSSTEQSYLCLDGADVTISDFWTLLMFMSQDTEKQSFKLDSSVSNKNPIANSKNQSDYSAYLFVKASSKGMDL